MKIWINKECAPMVSKTGWPTPINPNAEAWAQKEYLENLKQAKRDAVPLEEPVTILKTILRQMNISTENYLEDTIRQNIKTDTFIEVNIEVEFVHQMANSSNGTGWFDVTEVHAKYSPGFPTRTIARVVRKNPKNAASQLVDDEIGPHHHGPIDGSLDNGAHSYTEGEDIVTAVIQSQIGTTSQSEFIEAYKKEYFRRFPSYAPHLTDLEWYHLYLDAYDAIEQHCSTELKKQLTAAQERIKILENDLLDALDLKKGNGPTALSMLQQRVKELEEMYLIAEYALRDIDAYEDVSDPPIGTSAISSISRTALNKLSKMKQSPEK